MVILVVSILGVIPAAAAQNEGNSSISESVNKAVQSATESSNVEWARLVRREERRLRPGVTGASFYTLSTTNFKQQKVHESDRETFESYKALINKYLAKNHTLDRYTLVVPIPSDLATLSKEDINYLIGFLRQPNDEERFNSTYTPYSVTLAEKAVVEIKLLTPNKNILILRVDSLTSIATDKGLKKIVYFFLNEY